jgi:ABC-type multidrug transport system fused ATPase/permease subunit
MNRLSGKLGVNKYDLESGIAIVTQEAWIQNTTVMENILFGKPLDSQRYQSVLDACALVDDLEVVFMHYLNFYCL